MSRLTIKREDGYDACHHYFRTIVDKLGELEDLEEKGVLAMVIHGEWEPYPDVFHKRCSICKIEYDVTTSRFKGYYCPNCGAKMDGKKEGVEWDSMNI